MNEKNAGKKAKHVLVTLLTLILLVSLGGCSKSIGLAEDSSPNYNYANSGASGDMAPVMHETADDTGYESLMFASEGPGNLADITSSVQSGRKITFWADLSINTKSFDADYNTIIGMISRIGGYVSTERMTDYSTSYDRTQGRRTMIEAKIPASGYNSFLDALSGIGTVVSLNRWSEDLTSQYYDTEARITMLEMRKERLMGYLIEAERAEDVVAFERELSGVLSELDRYQSTRRYLEQLIDFATVTIYLNELITPETIGRDGEPLGDRASDAFIISANGVGRFLQGVVVFFAGAAPVLALLIVIAALVWLISIPVRKGLEKYRTTSLAQARQDRKNLAKERKIEKVLNQQEMYERVQAQRFQQRHFQPYPSPEPFPEPPKQSFPQPEPPTLSPSNHTGQ